MVEEVGDPFEEILRSYGEFILGPMHMLSFMDSNHGFGQRTGGRGILDPEGQG